MFEFLTSGFSGIFGTISSIITAIIGAVTGFFNKILVWIGLKKEGLELTDNLPGSGPLLVPDAGTRVAKRVGHGRACMWNPSGCNPWKTGVFDKFTEQDPMKTVEGKTEAIIEERADKFRKQWKPTSFYVFEHINRRQGKPATINDLFKKRSELRSAIGQVNDRMNEKPIDQIMAEMNGEKPTTVAPVPSEQDLPIQ